jgi:hypothetical protein
MRRAGQAVADVCRAAGEIVVRCRDGHLLTTSCIPLVSFKANRYPAFLGAATPGPERYYSPHRPGGVTVYSRRSAAAISLEGGR